MKTSACYLAAWAVLGAGAPQSVAVNGTPITVSDQPKQEMRYGIDAERLWHWTNDRNKELARAAVGDIKVDYVRVAIPCGAQREEETRYPNRKAFDGKILPMMKAMKEANPDIKFFASPQPLQEAYNKADREKIWGGSDVCPWSPYPAWILQFKNKGPDKQGQPKWKPASLDVEKLTSYFADYLNFMRTERFNIDYLDLVNENQFVTPEHLQYIAKHLKSKLKSGVQMPQLIAPSSWGVESATEWVNDADSTFFDIASTHNTGGKQSLDVLEKFVQAAKTKNIPAWNTELHEWIGPDLKSEILTTSIVWDTCRAGFSSFETWLFFGAYDGRRLHSMCLVDRDEGIRTTGKYSIFKKLVNETGGGNYVDVNEPSGLKTAAFRKENKLILWVLNPSEKSSENEVTLSVRKMIGDVEVSRWHSGLSTNQAVHPEILTLEIEESDRFSYSFSGESLYCFEIKLR